MENRSYICADRRTFFSKYRSCSEARVSIYIHDGALKKKEKQRQEKEKENGQHAHVEGRPEMLCGFCLRVLFMERRCCTARGSTFEVIHSDLRGFLPERLHLLDKRHDWRPNFVHRFVSTVAPVAPVVLVAQTEHENHKCSRNETRWKKKRKFKTWSVCC